MIVKPRILLIEDEPGTRFGYANYLAKSGFEISEAEDLEQAGQFFSTLQFDGIILDINLPDGSGIDFIDRVRDSSADIPLIVITGAGDIPLAVDAMRRGADNFLTKPVDIAELDVYLKKSLEIGYIRKASSSRQRLARKEDPCFGNSPQMREVLHLARMAADSDSQVLLTGETGTGKGVLARWIHRHSRRSSCNFVDVNCSGLKGDLLARELFGHVRGAFTSADRDREGLLDAADQGTLFLDEIGEMDLTVQAQFLKVLEEKTYRKLGDTRQQRSDFRLICATNRQIETALHKGEFRQDLYFRINLFIIHIPPLRDRSEDLAEIARHLLATGPTPQTGITEEALAVLQAYSWPGNVRELKNVLERALILSRGESLKAEHFAWLKATPFARCPGMPKTLKEMERFEMLAALERSGGDVAAAARSLGISRATLYRRLKDIQGNG